MTGLLPGLVILQAEAPDGGGPSFFIPMIAIFFIFYFLVIMPQRRGEKQKKALLESIERGDSVVTAGGLHGKVTGVTDDVLTVEIAALKSDRVRVKVARGRIESVEKAKKGEGS
jgi:preprotein translocase subunit YajC